VFVLEMACRGVQAVHDAGFAHCDLKTRNILLDRRGRVVIGDLGLAHRTTTRGQVRTAIVGGTADYMAPEVIAGSSKILAATLDVYALGVLAFVLVTGRRPFSGRTAQEIYLQHRCRPAPSASAMRPDLPEAIAIAIGRAMERDPAIRTSNASAFESALALAAAPLREEALSRSSRRRDHR
jgi:serine/threonine-protein kinase